MTCAEAQQIVGDVLSEIQGHPRRRLMVPHDFTVVKVSAIEHPNVFAPSLPECRVIVEMSLPIVYSAAKGKRCLPAKRRNIECLREVIEAFIGDGPAQITLDRWEVQPEEEPEPDGERRLWSVAATLDVW